MMRPVALVLAIAVLTPTLGRAQQPQPADLRGDAEKAFAEHSYARARELYLQAKAAPHPASDDRWLDFRLADTLWRSEAASESSDSTKIDAAREQLEALAAAVKRDEDRDRVWAEVEESLGDFWWTRRDSRNWGTAWPLWCRTSAGSRDSRSTRRTTG